VRIPLVGSLSSTSISLTPMYMSRRGAPEAASEPGKKGCASKVAPDDRVPLRKVRKPTYGVAW